MLGASSHTLVYSPEHQLDAQVLAFARYIGDLLQAEMCFESLLLQRAVEYVRLATNDGDLILFDEPEQSWLNVLLFGRHTSQALSQLTSSFLLARKPRWPIRKVLLVLRIEETDQAAIDWLIRLAKPSGALVTVLPLVPSLPAMYSLGNLIYAGPDVLLSSNSFVGQQLRRLTRQLNLLQIDGTLHLRQGEPDWQIRQEVIEGNHDLILIGEEPHGRIFRLLFGEQVSHLLRWLERPLFIARSTGPDQASENG
jgi:nucleotide-binding universal stress UspA family protein